jgi:hypothetical protein
MPEEAPKAIKDVDAIEIIKRVGGVASPLGIQDMGKEVTSPCHLKL